MADLEQKSRSSVEHSFTFHEVDVSKEPILTAHLAMLKQDYVYEMTLLSKLKLPQALSDSELLSEFKRHFSLVVPMQNVDCVFVTGLDHEEVEQMTATIGSLKSVS